VWDGNEVWLVAGGAILFFTFPRAFSAAFGGFYLAFFVLLWLLVPRGLALELRGHVASPLWWDFCDGAFFAASAALAFIYGVALGNVLRGVPLDADGYFFVPFWTGLGIRGSPGVFDWYTLMCGISGVAILIVHGAAFLAMRSTDPLYSRAIAAARWGALPAIAVPAATAVVTPVVNPILLHNFSQHPWAYALPATAAGASLAMAVLAWRGRERATFLASSLLILLLVGSAALALYPALLIATTGRPYDLTIYNSSATHYALTAGLVWAGVGLLLAGSYSAVNHYLFRGRERPADDSAAPEGAA